MRQTIYFFIVLGFLGSRLLYGQIGEDKVLHFGAGMVAGGAGAFVASELSHGNRLWTFTGAVGASLLAGMAKEAIDAGNANNKWDNGDLAATALGGVTIGVTIDLFTAAARKRKKKLRSSIDVREFEDRMALNPE